MSIVVGVKGWFALKVISNFRLQFVCCEWTQTAHVGVTFYEMFYTKPSLISPPRPLPQNQQHAARFGRRFCFVSGVWYLTYAREKKQLALILLTNATLCFGFDFLGGDNVWTKF